MMLYPAMNKLTEYVPNRYMMVNVVARRARQIATEAEMAGEPLDDKPVTIAILPDHPTPCAHRTHTAEPVPFLIYYPGIEPDSVSTFDELSCQKGAYGTLEKDEFIKTLLGLR